MSLKPDMSLELALWHKLQPVSLEELMASTYSVLATLKILMDSTQNLCDCSVSGGDIEWTGTPREKELVTNSLPWSYLQPIWQYAELGKIESIFDIDFEDEFDNLIKWVSAVAPICNYHGEDGYVAILKVMIKFFARLKLDYGVDFNDETGLSQQLGQSNYVFTGTNSINSLPQVDHKNLTVIEMALLSGVSNIRTIRNAQYDKDKPLQFFKKGKTVLVKPEVARVWLNLRREFVPSESA